MQIKGIRPGWFFAFMGVVALVLGIYMNFFSTRGYLPTRAEVIRVDKEIVDGEEETVGVYVSYTVDGKTYEENLGMSDSKLKKGDIIEAFYDPEDPSKIKQKAGFAGIYVLGVGVLLLLGSAYTFIKNKRGRQQIKEAHPFTGYAPSVKGEERELYFLTDSGTAKYGHRIEDRDRRVLYEAKVTKFTLTSDTGFDFIDHVNNKTIPHLVGHQEDQNYSTLLIDNRSSFTFDGEDIWDHLKNNGINVETGFKDGKILWLTYRILFHDEEIAYVEASSYFVHEEDQPAKSKLRSMVPARGFYRIWTKEQNLDVIFITLLAFARTEALDAQGGSYGLLFGRKNKK